MKLFRAYVNKLLTNVSTGSLFPQIPTIHFYPEVEYCPDCRTKLNVRNTQDKTVVTMDIGAFLAKETRLECPRDKSLYFSKDLRKLVPAHCTFGFDVIEYVGKALFLQSRNNLEIRKELAAKNISISEREVSYLGQKFITYLALAHQESADDLRHSMAKRGGYILHVDGTCEGDSPHLFCGLDGISEIVLGAIKIPSEKKEELIPFFRRIKKQYGNPIALVHDMGVAILSAIAVVFPDIADFICHFHFLRDIGKDLLLQDYQTIMKRLRKFNVRSSLGRKASYLKNKIGEDVETITSFRQALEEGSFTDCLQRMPMAATYLLINWALESSIQSQGYGFPFDRIHLDFYLRLKELHHLLEGISDIHLRNKAKDNAPFLRIWQLLNKVMQDKELLYAVESMQAKIKVFDKLRKALRIALPEGKNGLNDEGDETCIKTIEKEVTAFRDWVRSDEERKKTYAKMIEQIDKYWSKLFADPLVVNTVEGPVVILPQRTNNILERFFRLMKRLGRKKSGTASLNKMLKAILADTPLVRNLENEEYMDIILNGCATLAERFSRIDDRLIREQLKEAQDNQEKNFLEMKKIIRLPDLPNKIFTLFKEHRKIQANGHLRS
ncbi:MAG: MULE transposase domain protein [ANME-2 cluster archaeon HR1]|nr:MAG: MULE transposase domain protein [ANME-2 cluster archaeon HR1]